MCVAVWETWDMRETWHCYHRSDVCVPWQHRHASVGTVVVGHVGGPGSTWSQTQECYSYAVNVPVGALPCLDNFTDNTELLLAYLECLSTNNNDSCSIPIDPTFNSRLLENYPVSVVSSGRHFLLIYSDSIQLVRTFHAFLMNPFLSFNYSFILYELIPFIHSIIHSFL